MKTKVFGIGVILLSIMVIAAGYSYYQYNKPHIDIQAMPADIEISSDKLVSEFLENNEEATKKYLPQNASGKILVVSGTIASIDENMNGQQVILLKEKDKETGVSCTFVNIPNDHINFLEIGESIAVKGIIRSGADYDEDLDLYEDVILEKCNLYLMEN